MVCERLWCLLNSSRSHRAITIPRSVLGRLGLNPLSSEAWKQFVAASRFYIFFEVLKFSNAWQQWHALIKVRDVLSLAASCKR